MSPLEDRLSRLLKKRQSLSKLRTLKASDPNSVDFSSNDFLSLSSNTEFRRDYLTALDHGLASHGLGSTGSRLLDGNSTFAEDLEQEIAAFHGAEAALLTNSGYDANVSLFGFLPQPTDHVIYDELIHASVHDGLKLCRAESQVSFKHNDLDHLRQKLESLIQTSHSKASFFVAVESVYSMDGDLAPLKEMTDLIDELFPRKNCFLVVDEAHATGYFGSDGRGRVCELGLEQKIHLRLHTYGKAMAASGAAILCSRVIKSYLINYARPLIYTTFMSFPSLVNIKVAYAWLRQGKTNKLATQLWALIDHLYQQLQSLEADNANHYPPLVTVPNQCPESPIFALFSPQPRSLATYCQSLGFNVRAIFPPTVPEGTQRAYEASYNWGRINPDYYLCQSGTQQSPIALGLNQGLSNFHQPAFQGYDENVTGNFFNWGYGSAYTLHHEDGDLTTLPSMTFDNETVYLVGWHIHAPADHTVGGDRSKAELHFVHKTIDDEYRAVLAFRLDPGRTDSGFFHQLPPPIGFNDTTVLEGVELNLAQALDEVNYFNEFWTYKGSLTSPPCREGVRFFIARSILFTSVVQMQDILGVSTYSARAEQEVWLHDINV